MTLPVATAETESGELSKSFQPEVTHAISCSYLIGQSKSLNLRAGKQNFTYDQEEEWKYLVDTTNI